MYSFYNLSEKEKKGDKRVAKSFKEKEEIKHYMCDRKNRMTLAMLVNVLLETSGKQSELLKRDEEFVSGLGLSWIILHYDFSIERLPLAGETVEIETVATEYNKLFTYRDFYVRDESDNVIITVKTTFALMDSEKRKLARLPEIVIEPYGANFSKRIRRNTKAHPVESEASQAKDYSVRYFDIDSNNHVNNSQYINWALDSLDSVFLSTHTIKQGVISFEKEVKETDAVVSLSSERVAEEIYTDHQITVDGTVNCTATFTWERE